MIKGRREVSIAKGSQYGRILSITKPASLRSLVPGCFIYSLTTYFIKFSFSSDRRKIDHSCACHVYLRTSSHLQALLGLCKLS